MKKVLVILVGIGLLTIMISSVALGSSFDDVDVIIDEIEEEILNLEEEIVEMQLELSGVEVELKRAEIELKKKKAEISELMARILELYTKIEKAESEAELREVQREIDGLKSEFRTRKREYSRIKRDLEGLRYERKRYLRELDRFRRERERLRPTPKLFRLGLYGGLWSGLSIEPSTRSFGGVKLGIFPEKLPFLYVFYTGDGIGGERSEVNCYGGGIGLGNLKLSESTLSMLILIGIEKFSFEEDLRFAIGILGETRWKTRKGWLSGFGQLKMSFNRYGPVLEAAIGVWSYL